VDAFEHNLFKEVLAKVANVEICYKATEFYVDYEPLKLNDLLLSVVDRLDHTRVVTLVRKLGHLAVIKQYLLKVQNLNILAVNVAINEQYVEEEDFNNLRNSIQSFENIDTLSLAKTLEKHNLIEFRRIAAHLYNLNGRSDISMELSKNDQLWKDAIETAASSKKTELCENLLRFFVEKGRKDCFAATLYSCYDYLSPDVVLELSWRANMTDYAMPYMVQVMKEFGTALKQLNAVNRSPHSSFSAAPEGFVPVGMIQQQIPAPQMYSSVLPMPGHMGVSPMHMTMQPGMQPGFLPPGTIPMGSPAPTGSFQWQ